MLQNNLPKGPVTARNGHNLPVNPTELTVEQIKVDEGRLRAKRGKTVQHEENIKRLTDNFMAKNRTLESFLSSISFSVVSFDY